MTNLVPVASFDDVPQLELNTIARGGTGGPMNAQAQALLNRMEYLRAKSQSVDDHGAVGDGTTDDTTAIQAAVAQAGAAGGGRVRFSGGKTYALSASIVLPTGVVLDLVGATIKWIGTASPVIMTATTGHTFDAGIEGGTIDGGATASTLIEMSSTYHCHVRDVTLKSANATNIALDLLVNNSGTTNPDGNRNNVFNEFANLVQEGTCGTAVRMMGQGPVGGPPIAVVTLNTFTNFNGRGQAVRGVDFAAWADSNYFAGVTRLCLVANNAVGVEWNTGNPTLNVGVYANNFDHLAVDTFAGPTGRIGLKMNYTKLNKVDFYFNDPPAEGGAYIFNASTQSYYVLHQPGLTSNLVLRQKLSYLQGKDNAVLGVGCDGEISTETVGLSLGVGRTGSGFALIDLVGDTTNTAYGLRIMRNSGGANTSSSIRHKGVSSLVLMAEDVGGQVLLQAQNGVKVAASNTGLGFYGVAAQAQPTTASGSAVFVAGTGTAINDASTFDGYTIKQVVKALRTLGLLA